MRFQYQNTVVERLGVGFIDLDQLIEVAPGKKGFLGRGDHHPGDLVLFRFQAREGGRHGFTVGGVHGVGALAGHVQGQYHDLVLAFFVTNGIGHDKFLRLRGVR